MIVVASALLEVLLNTPAAARVGERLFAAGETLHASAAGHSARIELV